MSGRTLPTWSRDETLLALALAVSRFGERIDVENPDIVALSGLLRAAGEHSDARFRNPHAVARKVWAFAARLDGGMEASMSPVERSVWDEFMKDRQQFGQSVVSARARLVEQSEMPTRGPLPAIGTFEVERPDGPSAVYAAVLEGLRLKSGDVVIKIGMTGNVHQRQRQLNFGLPRPLCIRWRIIRTWPFGTARTAYQAEQTILRSAALSGQSIGGEFVRVASGTLDHFLHGCDTSIWKEQSQRVRPTDDPRRGHRASLRARRQIRRRA